MGTDVSTPLQKMTVNNPNVDLVRINSYKICPFVLQILSGNEILANIKCHNSGTNVRKMMCNDYNVDLVNMNA